MEFWLGVAETAIGGGVGATAAWLFSRHLRHLDEKARAAERESDRVDRETEREAARREREEVWTREREARSREQWAVLAGVVMTEGETPESVHRTLRTIAYTAAIADKEESVLVDALNDADLSNREVRRSVFAAIMTYATGKFSAREAAEGLRSDLAELPPVADGE